MQNLDLPDDVKTQKDTLRTGGTGRPLLETGAYKMRITEAYFRESSGGAMGLHLQMEVAQGKGIYREAIYITSGLAKGQKTYYESNGEKYPLPGWVQADQLCRLVCGKRLNEIRTEPKQVEVYDFQAQGKIHVNVEMLTQLLGKVVAVAVYKVKEYRRIQNEYNEWVEDTHDEPKLKNEIFKFFREGDLRHIDEIDEGKDATFLRDWLENWKNKTKDMTASNRSSSESRRAPSAGTAPDPTMNQGDPYAPNDHAQQADEQVDKEGKFYDDIPF